MGLCSASAAAPFRPSGADRQGRLTGQHGEPLPDRCRSPRERGIKNLDGPYSRRSRLLS